MLIWVQKDILIEDYWKYGLGGGAKLKVRDIDSYLVISIYLLYLYLCRGRYSRLKGHFRGKKSRGSVISTTCHPKFFSESSYVKYLQVS